MAQIKLKNSVTAGSVPAGLSFGEVAVNITDKKIFAGNAVESTVTIYDPNNHVLSFNGSTGAVTFNNYVASVNGSTGAITDVARTNEGNTFSVRQVMSAGISSANLNVSGGATFTTISSSSTTDCVDILASTNGIGLRVAQNVGGGAAGVGGIRLGRSSTTALNYLLYAASGTFYVINGTGGTDPQLMSLNSVDANFNVPIRGATFSSSAGRITVQKSSYIGSDSGTVRIVGVDALSSAYNSDIRANADAAADTTHTLPATSGTLLNTASSYVISVNGQTGAVTISSGGGTPTGATGYLQYYSASGFSADNGLIYDPALELLRIGSTSRYLSLYTSGASSIVEGNGNGDVYLQHTNKVYVGDGVANQNNTYVSVDDSTAEITLNSSTVTVTGNLSAPNIVNSVNGQTGAVTNITPNIRGWFFL